LTAQKAELEGIRSELERVRTELDVERDNLKKAKIEVNTFRNINLRASLTRGPPVSSGFEHIKL
jgi:hypothetical protein